MFQSDVSITIRWIDMQFGTDINGAQTMNPNEYGDHLTFNPATLASKSFHLINKLLYILHILLGLAETFLNIFMVHKQ